ncbi:MAG: transposase [Armatimonadetes bacterium]|nr:transposase [Armatimonadota bacterium]
MMIVEESRNDIQERFRVQSGGNGAREGSDPEVVEKPVRRRFSAAYKLSILRAVDSMSSGEIGAFLRREGLYWTALTRWRRERETGTLSGLEPKKRGRQSEPKHPLANKLTQLERDNARLRRELEKAEKIIEVQKKRSELFGLEKNPPGGNL